MFFFSTAKDETNDEKFLKNTIEFSILSDENNGNTTVDDDDVNLCRLERFNSTLGI